MMDNMANPVCYKDETHDYHVDGPLDLHVHSTVNTPRDLHIHCTVNIPRDQTNNSQEDNGVMTASEPSPKSHSAHEADHEADGDTERIRKSTCSSCHQLITDEYIMRVAHLSWHSACLTCTTCEQVLHDKCYYKLGKLYCANHFNKELASQCSGCHEQIEQSELIQKSRGLLYHLECFHCIVCGQQLNTGDEYYLLNETNKLVCKMDFETAKTKGYDGNKRPRTTISAKQLEALKKAYEESNKPARHVRERLSLQTGLDMRVVQVWFQNRRAKEKRVNKEHKAGSTNYDYMLDEMSFAPPSSVSAPYLHTQWPSGSSSVHVEHTSQYGASDTHPPAFVCAALTHGLSFPNIASQQFGNGGVAFEYH